jgi:hypothetical protein
MRELTIAPRELVAVMKPPKGLGTAWKEGHRIRHVAPAESMESIVWRRRGAAAAAWT